MSKATSRYRLIDQADYIADQRGPVSDRVTVGLLREGAEEIARLRADLAQARAELEQARREQDEAREALRVVVRESEQPKMLQYWPGVVENARRVLATPTPQTPSEDDCCLWPGTNRCCREQTPSAPTTEERGVFDPSDQSPGALAERELLAQERERREALEEYGRNLLAVSRAVGVLGATEVSKAEESLDSLLAAAPAATGRDWQPIESAPKDGTQIIVTNGTLRLAVRWWHGVGWSDNGRHDLKWGPVTHWMPLPDAPTAAHQLAHTTTEGEP